MTSPDALAAAVVAALTSRDIEIMLVGAAALAVRGVPRGTLDIDFLTTDSRVLALDWSDVPFPETQVEIRVGEFDDPLAGVVRWSQPAAGPVDLIVGRWNWQREILARSPVVDLETFSVRVPTAGDLVILKLDAGGYLDLRDAAQLIETHGAEVRVYVERQMGSLPDSLQAQWRRFVLELPGANE